MNDDELAWLDIAEAGRLFRSRALSPVELTAAQLRRLERLNPALNAIATVTAERARDDAARAERELGSGHDRGPLHGIPVSLKDNIDTAGIRTTAGCRLFSENVPTHDSAVAARLRQAGAVLLGKANLHELALGVETTNGIFGQTRNPWDLMRIPGGSSGGSGAAVAAGIGFASIGTDSGGSVRIPASLCGVTGLKPTYGRVSNAGNLPNYPSFDCAGPLTRGVADAAHVLSAIAGYDPDDFAAARTPIDDYAAALDGQVRGLRMGIPRDVFSATTSAEVSSGFEHALGVMRDLGASTADVRIPGLAEPMPGVIGRPEISQHYVEAMRVRPEDFSPPILRKVRAGLQPTLLEHLDARRASERVAAALRRTLEAVDVLALPTTPIVAALIEGSALVDRADLDELEGALISFARMFNFLRVPALSVLCGFTESGLPIGLQLVGRPFDEALLLRTGDAYERATDHRRRRPPPFPSS